MRHNTTLPHSIQTSAWSSCSVTCGPGTQTRTVVCVTALGNVVANTNCVGTAPTASQACNLGGCAGATYSWSVYCIVRVIGCTHLKVMIL